MSALELEILQKFHQLDQPSKLRLLEHLQQDVQAEFDPEQWWDEVEALQAKITHRLGPDTHIGILDLLDELREDIS